MISAFVTRCITYLLDKANIPAQPTQVELVDRPSVKLDGSRRGIVPPLDKANNGTLSGTAWTLATCQLNLGDERSSLGTVRGTPLTTKAVTLPAGTVREKLSNTVIPGRVG